MIQEFIYHGIPKAQGRPKFFRRGNFTGAYDPKDSREYKNNVAAQIVAQKPQLIEQGKAVSLVLKFYLPRPKSHYGKYGIKEKCLLLYHTSKPDLDNMVKAVKDALKGIVWHDDSQVYHTIATKTYTGNEPLVQISVGSEEG